MVTCGKSSCLYVRTERGYTVRPHDTILTSLIMVQYFQGILSKLQGCWRQTVATALVYKVLAFVLLTPLAGLLVRLALATSGDSVLADQDILFFLLGPLGALCGLLIGAVWLAIVALELTAILGVLAVSHHGRSLHVRGSIAFAAHHACHIMTVALRIVALLTLLVAPFLMLIGLIYVWLLSEHDINFYLIEKPPEFLLAIALAAGLLLVLTFLMLRVFADWFLALPLVLFESTQPSESLRVSKGQMQGNRREVLMVILVWLVVSAILTSISTWLVLEVGQVVVPRVSGSLSLLVLVIGAFLLVWGLLGLIVNIFSTLLFAAMMFEFYVRFRGEPLTELAGSQEGEVRPIFLKLTARRLVVISLASVVLSAAAGASLARTLRMDDDVVVIAHRGASARAPENSMAAVEQAIEEDADWVEIDVQETADGQVVLFHDSDFMKLAGNPLKIWEATQEDIAEIDIGSSFDPRFSDQRVPLLSDVLAACKDNMNILIELKYYGHDQQLEQRVLDLVQQHDMTSQVMYMSLKRSGVEKMSELDPEAKVGLLLSVAAGDLKSVPVDFWGMNAQFATRRTIRDAHRSNRLIYVWTVNDAVTASRMIGRGVDGLITDDPALVSSVLQQRAQLSPAERLLLELADVIGINPKVVDQ